MEGVNKLVAKEMIVNQDSHFKNEISKLEGMVANNDFGQMYVQKSNKTNGTNATTPVAAQVATKVAAKVAVKVAAPVVAPVSKPVAKPEAKPATPSKVPDAAAVVAANDAALEANAQKEQAAKAEQKKTNEDISIETSKLDDTNFDNLGQSLDSGKSKDDIKKEISSMAKTLSEKDAAEKKQVAEDKQAATEEDDEEQTNKSKPQESSNSYSVETSSLTDPFEAASAETKPKESSKIQLAKSSHKHHKKHKKHHKVKEETAEESVETIPDMVQISQIRDVDNDEMYGECANY